MLKKASFISIILLSALIITDRGFADVSARFKQALTHQEQEQYEQAERSYKQIVKAHPGTDDALQAQKNLAILYVEWDKQTQAQAVLQELIGNFSIHKGIAAAVTYVADAFRKMEKHEKACEIYRYVVDNWPKDEHAMWSQMNLVISNTCLGNNDYAETAFKKLCSDYSEYELIAKAICLIADNYRRLEQYEKARKLYKRALDSKPDVDTALWSRMGLGISNLRFGEEFAAQQVFNKLLTDFSKDERMASAGCFIGDEYRSLKMHDNACKFYQYVIENWPMSLSGNPFFSGQKIRR